VDVIFLLVMRLCSFSLLLHKRREKRIKREENAIVFFVACGADLTKWLFVLFALANRIFRVELSC